ncbi:MAG: hypothetical protein JWP69_854 [Flaviaesturariibacter sp.]|nr:hypothetical protein [Flaviaesturariibacter sp.]
MPIFFEKHIDADTKLAIWKIEEPEDFFLDKVPLQRNITHPHKRLQHLAGRYLLQYLFPDFPTDLIQLADTRKPYLADEAYHFSISHCGDYAAAIVSPTKRVGIDIEGFSAKVLKIEHKFISPNECPILNALSSIPDQLSTDQQINRSTLLWSCKEAIFKWHGSGGVDFRKHMQILAITETNDWLQTKFAFKKSGNQLLDLHSCMFKELCLSYLAT